MKIPARLDAAVADQATSDDAALSTRQPSQGNCCLIANSNDE
jgi:hypothetical protein